MTVTQRVDEPADEDVFDDPARGRRRIWRDAAGRPIRVELADGSVLGVDRDDDGGRIAITTEHGLPLLTLTSPVVIPDAIRAFGLTPMQAADIDGVHRLTATDPVGTTSTELRERSVRVERDGQVLRIDADDEGRPRRVTTPGFDDLVHRRSDGCWEVSRLDGPVLLTVKESDDATTYRTTAQHWTESPNGTGIRWTDGPTESPVAEVALDPAGRITGHTWHGGRMMRYSRDDIGRLAGWTESPCDPNSSPTVHVRHYAGNELSGLVTNGVRSVVRTDAGGRIRKLIGPQHTTSYDYDANGRRVTRRYGGAETSYRYDALGQLRAVTTAQRSVTYEWDALGRRIGVTIDGVGYLEHRDPTGRLWSVTTAHGEPVCRFIWWNGRVLARCDETGAIDETYLTDPFGTLIGVATADTGWQFTDAIQPPFGTIQPGTGWRPTLFGHISDGATGLICFGARELDPETGSFLTPDPWHGDPDDPRRLAGQPASTLPTEAPSTGVHAYALSQHDPLARPDNDGHFGIANLFLTLVLGPTWGAALTSLSLFLFAPLNIYMEVIGLLGFLGGRHLWPQHSIFGLRGLSGSARLGTFALALNGFFPRAMAGVNGDRCITIGHVVWESRHSFRMLDRAQVLELDDISGTPAPDGTPTQDARRFSDQPQGSILVVTSTDTDRRQLVHAAWWTRGPGNAVGIRGGDQTFEDRVLPGESHARGTVHLAQPIPIDMPTPRSAGDHGTLTVDEYAVSGGHSSTADLVPDVWFAFDAKGSDIAATTVLGISAGNVPAAYGAVLTVVSSADPTVILDHNLPHRFTSAPSVRDSVTLQRLTSTTVSSAGWAAPSPNKLELAAPSHPVAVGDIYRCVPTTPDPATPERPDAYTAIEAVTVALTVSPTLGADAVTGSALYRLAPDGAAANGTHPDPVDHPDQVSFLVDHPFAVDDLVQVVAGALTSYGRVTAVTAAVPSGSPALITLDEPLAGVPAGSVRVARLKETSRDTDKGTIATQAGDSLTVGVTSTSLFAIRQPVLIDGAPRRVRQVSTITAVDADTVDGLVGTGPFTLTKFTPTGSRTKTKLSSARFVRHTGGDLPSLYGNWPAAIMGLVPRVPPAIPPTIPPTVPPPAPTPGYTANRQPSGWRYFLKANPAPGTMHPSFNAYWEPVTVGGAHYWLLSKEVKIVEDGTDFFWEPDDDDNHPARHRQQIIPDSAGAFALTVRGFGRTTVTRPEAGGGPVFAYPAEVQVPEEPGVRWSLADALADHELVHTLQNTWWGPILGAMPLQGAFRTVRDVLVANDVDRDSVAWMDYHPFADLGADGFDDSNLFEMLSIGGLMQIIWSFVILGPALINDDARKAILSTNFDDWSSVFNPVNQAIIDAIPRVQDDVETSKDVTVVLGRALTRALDFKAWTPFMGFIKLLLPDGPRNFLEQQASRKSGDLYSTILSVDDKFNAELSVKRDLTDANVDAPLGDGVRLLSHFQGRLSRNQRMDRCDSPGSHLVTFSTASTSAAIAPILQFFPDSDALLPADLYEHVPIHVPLGAPPFPTPTLLEVDGPTAGGTMPVTVTRLWIVPAGMLMRPRLRAIVPLPPRVSRTLGCYLVPASPGVWSATAPDAFVTKPENDAHTGESTITITSIVTLEAEEVPWVMPTVSTPSGPVIARFITEKQHLSVADRSTTQWAAEADHGITLTARTGGRGWDLTVDPPPPAMTLPTQLRVRIWARVKPTDPDLFDLTHSDAPHLEGVRSYLESDLWIPVRDFLIAVTDLPALPLGGGPATMTARGSFDLDLPIKVAGPASIVPTGALVRVALESDVTPTSSPRGERWKFVVSGDKFVETPQVVPVVVRFAPPIERRFELTVEPNFTLDAATFDVTTTTPLDLSITGGTGPFSVMNEAPNASRGEATVAGSTVTVTIAPPPTPAPTSPPVVWQLRVQDSTGAVGARTLILHP